MLKRVCDRCNGEDGVSTYFYPLVKEKDLSQEIIMYNGVEVNKIDLCGRCADKLERLLTSFRRREL